MPIENKLDHFDLDGVGGIESTKKDKKERREGVYLNKEKCF